MQSTSDGVQTSPTPIGDCGPSVTFDTVQDPRTDMAERSPEWREEPSEFQHHFGAGTEETECVQRIICEQDFPSSWQPARRIITFMGIVSLICTMIVIAIILIAVVLSKNAFPKPDYMITNNKDIVYLIPHPTKYSDKMPTLLLHRDHPRIWQSYVDELRQLLRAYKDKQGITPAASACDLRYAPTGGSSCYFPLERINDNCTSEKNFGYDTGSPCIALVFNVFLGWSPIPFNASNPNDVPEDIRSEYDPHLVYVTCRCHVIRYGNATDDGGQTLISYTPYHGFPFHFLSSAASASRVPPLVMVQFQGLKPQSEVRVTCSLWARNVPRNTVDKSGAGTVRFNIVVAN